MLRLKTKTCIITGAGRGIGAAIARAFAREGASVVVTDKHEASAADVSREIGGEAMRLDVAQEADWQALAAAWPEFDVMVNNAGVTGFEQALRAQDPENASLDDWRAVHAVNLDGTFLGCRYAIRAMRIRGAGSIINISSRSGLVGIPAAAAYASSKAAVRNHTKSVALLLSRLTIPSSENRPAAIEKPQTEAWPSTALDQLPERITNFLHDGRQPQRRTTIDRRRHIEVSTRRICRIGRLKTPVCYPEHPLNVPNLFSTLRVTCSTWASCRISPATHSQVAAVKISPLPRGQEMIMPLPRLQASSVSGVTSPKRTCALKVASADPI